jgi:hypothetical protein
VLLSKIERKKLGEETFCTITKFKNSAEMFQQTMESITVVGVADDVYYPALNRPAGEMHPLDTPKE